MYAPYAYIFLPFVLISSNFFKISSVFEEEMLIWSRLIIIPFIFSLFFMSSKLFNISVNEILYLFDPAMLLKIEGEIILSSVTSEGLNNT